MLVQAVAAFAVVITAMIVAIIRFKVHPLVAMLVSAVVLGLGAGIPASEVPGHLTQGFGGGVGGIGLLVLFGMILGTVLQQSGAASAMANLMLRRVAPQRLPLALNLTGYAVGGPVTFDPAFVVLAGVAKDLARSTKIPYITLVTGLSVGLQVAHNMLIPTPGPFVVAGNVGASIPWLVLWGVVVSLPAALVGGVVYGKWLGRRLDNVAVPAMPTTDLDPAEQDEAHTPGVGAAPGSLGIGLVLLPILLILLGHGVTRLVDEGSAAHEVLSFVGNPTIALFISAIVSYVVLRKYLPETLTEVVRTAVAAAAPTLAVVGASGAIGRMIAQSAIGTELPERLGELTETSALGTVMVIIAWVVALTMRLAIGGTSTSLLISSTVIGPLIAGMPGVSPVLVALAITAGALGPALPNGPRFWLVSETSGLGVKNTLRSWTVGLTISSVVGLVLVVLLSLFASALPGLH